MIQTLPRINELANKKRTIGLTEAELAEQQVLRQAYLQEIRGQVLGTMTKLTVIDIIGNDVTPDKLKKYQETAANETK